MSVSSTQEQNSQASLVAQWWTVCLPGQETWVQPLVREDPTCHGATKPVYHNMCSRAWEQPLLSPCAAATEVCVPAGLQEKPPQREVRTQKLERSPHLTKLTKSLHDNKDPAQPKINNFLKFFHQGKAKTPSLQFWRSVMERTARFRGQKWV